MLKKCWLFLGGLINDVILNIQQSPPPIELNTVLTEEKSPWLNKKADFVQAVPEDGVLFHPLFCGKLSCYLQTTEAELDTQRTFGYFSDWSRKRVKEQKPVHARAPLVRTISFLYTFYSRFFYKLMSQCPQPSLYILEYYHCSVYFKLRRLSFVNLSSDQYKQSWWKWRVKIKNK